MFRVTAGLRFIEPQLPSLVDQPPEGKHWIHEIKHDGYRSLVIVERGGVRVTRNGHSIVRAAADLRCQSAIIDGEAIVQNGDGASDFEALRSAMRRPARTRKLARLRCVPGSDLRFPKLAETPPAISAAVDHDGVGLVTGFRVAVCACKPD
jgi:bifunctional non-homologous end joining protein LigD